MVKMDRENRAKQFAPFAALKGHEEALREKEAPVVDLQNQTIIKVIASFNKEGDMIPLYFDIDGISIKIDNIKTHDNAVWGSRYRCQITLIDHVETVELYYYNVRKIWTLRKK